VDAAQQAAAAAAPTAVAVTPGAGIADVPVPGALVPAAEAEVVAEVAAEVDEG